MNEGGPMDGFSSDSVELVDEWTSGLDVDECSYDR